MENKKIYTITDIHFSKGGSIHALLREVETKEIAISATLEYILNVIEERGYEVNNAR
jgi:hypothetical protein